ncbi:MAG: radical SAM protein [bacterium]|nr:radical SAM protein [bacterium]
MRHTLEEKLNFYAFLCLNTLDDDLYPHAYYGRQKIRPDEIKKAWGKCLRDISNKRAPEKLGLYVHLPFCHHKCKFCSCDSYVPGSYREVKTYLRALEKEVLFFEKTFQKGEFTSVYFGGGTPSLLRMEDLEHLFSLIFTGFRMKKNAQIIFEANPSGLNEKLIELLSRYRTTRLTIGVQSFDRKVLSGINRFQTREQFLEGFRLARKYKIPFINIDLMAGLPSQSVASFIRDLKFLLRLKPDMVHIFSFLPLDYTPFIREGGSLSRVQTRNRETMLRMANDILAEYFSCIPHEVMGREGAENVQEVDMRRQNSSLLGLGYGSKSHVFGHFWYQHPKTMFFKNEPKERIPDFIGIPSSLKEEMRKFVINNIQTGFERKAFYRLFKKDILKIFPGEITELASLKKVFISRERIISGLTKRREIILLLKFFYSPERIRTILEHIPRKYDPGKNYLSRFNYLYAKND